MSESETNEEYAIKEVEGRFYPIIVDREAGGHYEINNPLTGGTLSYKTAEAAETYVRRARDKAQR